MYASLARFGYGLVKAIKPDKVKKFLQPGLEKIAKPATKAKKLSKTRATFNKGVRGVAKRGYEGYTKAYDFTLGSPTRRKVTTAALTGYGLSSLLDEDDSEY